MSFLYPRTVSINRPNPTATGVGAQPYGGLSPQNESVIATGVPASIQAKRARPGDDRAKLPGGPAPMLWDVLIPVTSVAQGTIKDRDVVVDDEGYRYQVIGAYWNSLGYRLLTERLEV